MGGEGERERERGREREREREREERERERESKLNDTLLSSKAPIRTKDISKPGATFSSSQENHLPLLP